MPAHNNLGVRLKEQGNLDQAAACYRRALELKPDYALACNNLAVVLTEQGKLDQAVAACRRALELKPDYAEAFSTLATALKAQGKDGEALSCWQRALELKPDSAELHSNLGVAYKDQGLLDEARACWRKATALRPDFAEAFGNLGSVAEETGDFAAAEEAFRRALRQNPRFALGYYKLAEVLGGRLPDEDIAAQRRLLEDAATTDAQRLLLHFGLAQVLDARGEYAEAAEHLARGNALQLVEWRKRGQEYDVEEHEMLVAALMDVSMPDFFARVQGGGLESEVPVFVVGLPRSGTTLIEQIMASHSRVFGAGEIKLVHQTMALLGERGIGAYRGTSPPGRPQDPRAGLMAPGAASSPCACGRADRQQNARQLPVPRGLGGPFPAGEVHPLPPRPPRCGRLLLDEPFSGDPLDERLAAHHLAISPVRADHGALAGGIAVARARRGVRGDGDRSRRRCPAVGGLVRAGMGAGLPAVSPDAAFRTDGQCHASAAADLRHVCWPLAALRGPTGRVVRSDREDQLIESSCWEGLMWWELPRRLT